MRVDDFFVETEEPTAQLDPWGPGTRLGRRPVEWCGLTVSGVAPSR